MSVPNKDRLVLALAGCVLVTCALTPECVGKTEASKKGVGQKTKPVPQSVSAIGKDSSEKEVVESFLAAITRSGQDNSKAAFDEAARYMAFDEMARRAFGETGWPKFSSAEQKEIAGLFRRLIELRFYPRWRRVFQSGQFTMSSQSKQAGDSLVAGTLAAGGGKDLLTFRLIRSPEGFKLVSMSIKDKDMLDRTSHRLKRGLANKGAAGLIAHLRKKTKEVQEDSKHSQPIDELISGGK